MTIINKLFLGVGLVATGGEVVTHGEEHAATVKKLAAPILNERRPDKGIREVSISELGQLPEGIQRIQD